MTRNLPLPTFIIAGATRSGTATLQQILRSHPDVFMPEKKELHFFDVDANFAKGLDSYRKMFRGWSGQPAVGEATPAYFIKGRLRSRSRENYVNDTEDSMARIARSIPDIKIVISLRNPLERLLSSYTKNVLQAKISQTAFNDILRDELHGRSHNVRFHLVGDNDYPAHLRNVLNRIPREQIEIIIFEEWTHSLDETLGTLARFIGLPPDRFPLREKEVHNTVGEYTSLASLFLRKIVSPIRRQKSVGPVSKLYLPDDLTAELTARFAAQKTEVESLIGRRIPAWAETDG